VQASVDFSDQVSFKQLYEAWQLCQRRKAGSAAAQRYEMQLLDHLFDTQASLQSGQYQSTASYSFVTTTPKLREIHAAQFKDRVVHHLLVPRLDALWEPWLIHDLYSNRKGKGTHKAVKRCQQWMRKADTAYYLQLDIHNFFYSIDRSILLQLLDKGINKSVKQNSITAADGVFLRYLCEGIMSVDYSQTHELDPRASANLPDHKRLSRQTAGKGLPIGNLTSQFFGNVYLNVLDQFVKHTLKCRYYMRFVDDMILLHKDPETLRAWQTDISHFLHSELLLEVKKPVLLKPLQQGANFLGYIIRPYYLLVRQRVVIAIHAKLGVFESQLLHHNTINLTATLADAVVATIASFIGHCKHAHSLQLISSLWRHFTWLHYMCGFDPRHYRLYRTDVAPKTARFTEQVQFFRQHFPTAKLCVQFGRQTKVFLPESPTKQRIIITQAGFNTLGIRQRRIACVHVPPLSNTL
jgi:hypothetical protein